MRHGETLLRRWSDREAWLGKHRDWFSLSDDEQKRLPEAQMLYAIDAEDERSTRARARVLRRLRLSRRIIPAHIACCSALSPICALSSLGVRARWQTGASTVM